MNSKYATPSIALHWLMLLLLAAVYACMELRGLFPKGSAVREGMKTWHYMLGLSVFVLAWLRLGVSFFGTIPAIVPAAPPWQRRFSGFMKIALHAVMLGMPVLGWFLLSAEAKPIPFFGLHLPALIGESPDFADQIKDVHESVGTLGYVLIGLHAAAALYHHYIAGDNTLRRMLPFKD